MRFITTGSIGKWDITFSNLTPSEILIKKQNVDIITIS